MAQPAAAHADDLFSWSRWVPDFATVAQDGRNEVLVTGYTWHNPNTYETTDNLNNLNWGAGYARYLDHSDGVTDMLFGMVFADSDYNPEPVLGFQRQWKIIGNEVAQLGIGYAAGLTARRDIWDGIPFPFILPVLGVRFFERLDVFFTYVPPLPSSASFKDEAPGDIAFMFIGLRF